MTENETVHNGSDIYLSKTLFIKGLQCHKSLYLHKYRPELKDALTKETERLFSSGHEVGKLAQNLFPGGIEVPYEGLSHFEQLEMTQSLIKEGRDTLYEAAFCHDGVFVKADILHRGSDGWDFYEVKKSSHVYPHHVNDLSLQYHVLTGSGIPVSRAFIVHIDNKYIRNRDIDVEKLFSKVDLTEIVKDRQAFIAQEIAKERIMLRGKEPAIDIGPHCYDPYACDFKGHCWSHIPSPSVFDYRDIGMPDSFALYRQGIVKMEDVSPDTLGWRQKLQLDGVLYQKNHIDIGAVKAFIDSLWYPLCFMDFETTCRIPIPLFDGTRPNQFIPFQFSLHIMDKPDGELSHYEFLAGGKVNPQKEFLEKLFAAVPRNACILVWNQSFEVARLKELADAFPDKKADIFAMIGNVRDLMMPFSDKSIYHWQFNGSYSIKDVLPALVPELSYDNLEVSDGGTASSAWVRMIQSNDNSEKETFRKELLEYCHLDTLAMVKILEKISIP